MDEIWSKIAGFPDYEVSRLGAVKNVKTDRLLAISLNQQGRPKVNLRKNGETVTKSLAVLVARAHVPRHKRRDYTSIIHRDGDYENCSADNLRWRPRHYTVKYHQQFDTTFWEKATMAVVELESGHSYSTVQEAAIENGLLAQDVIMSSYARTYTWPTFQRFQIVDDHAL